MLEINNITKSYGKKTVLYDVNVTLNKGIYGLLGLNGAGKTTLINIITGIMKADSGSVLYNGTDIRQKKSRYKNNLGFMPQYSTFYPDFTAREFLKYMCVMKKVPKKEHRERINSMLEKVNLTASADMRIGTFSGGMRQRIGIAQALINDPDVIILDEPTAGLDPAERIRFRHTIEELSVNTTIFLATHIVQDVESMADHILFLDNGVIETRDNVEEDLEGLDVLFGNV